MRILIWKMRKEDDPRIFQSDSFSGTRDFGCDGYNTNKKLVNTKSC